MKKLISMTDFVLEQRISNEKIINASFLEIKNHIGNYYDKVFAYAKFLKQPLTLGMFVPCDEDGYVLIEPNRWADYLSAPESFDGNKEWYEFNVYEEAKERVLFHIEIPIDVEVIKYHVEMNRDVEYLANKDFPKIKLTETAKKQIGL